MVLSSGAAGFYAIGMKPIRVILLTWLTMLAGCGESPREKLVRSPEVQRRLKEIAEKNRAIEQKRQRMIETRRAATASGQLPDEAPVPALENTASENTASENTASNDTAFNDTGPNNTASDNTGPEKTAPDSTPPDKQPAISPTGPPNVPRPATFNRLDLWRRLRAGLPRKVIRQWLGEPTVTKRDAFLEYWYYGQGAGAGKISFVKNSGQMFGWNPPLQP